MKRCWVIVVSVLLAGGCGRKPEPAREATEPVPAGVVAEAEPGSGRITGTVLLKGPAPARQRVRMGADPACEHAHSEPVWSEDVLVNEDGSLRNVFVYVKSGLGNRRYPAPQRPAVLDQLGCMYRPRVFGLQTGQPLVIRNSDDTLHNVHAMAQANRSFNVGQPHRGMETTRRFEQPEVMVRFKCDVHPWMNAYAGVLDHPFFAVTGDGGAFALENLPAGEYVVEAWHEKYGVLQQTVVVAPDETKTISFEFSP